MKRTVLYPIFAILFCTVAQAKLVHEQVTYELDGTKFRGHLIYNQDAAMGRQNLPGIFMVPNWMGPDKASTLEKAKQLAGETFAVFVADMYGVDVRPTSAKEAGVAAGFVRSDRELMRARAQEALDSFKALASEHPIDTSKLLGAGFCFGGGTLLEYARTGSEDLDGIVSFHGDLASPTLQSDAQKVNIPLLVLHGADDPYVPQEDVQAFIKAMRKGGVDDWTLVQFSNTVHSFTDPTAQSDGAHYQPRTAKRAFAMMEDLANEVLELEN
ncbi:dienelactone hydrolase [Coraliomargarita sinensis]|uniref:Dienelactone hydrolase n=1 Tax=Coraliomargarita sinensis TaxID=2174842 RepID=A0A317ZNZ3_9BACT|nr:dienelactone hydrolase family protein [Coraliomargarita sinensis]PXA05579.1 dienelactone hydrolase [Coraliomargarita sinensis]